VIRTNNNNAKSVAEIKKSERAAKELELKELAAKAAEDRFGKEQIVKWSNQYKGLFFLPITDDEGNIEKLAIMKPIDRHILSYASTKINDEGLYAFLEACMRECFIDGDKDIIDDDEYFIPAANTFNKILEGKKAHLLKR
jgi:hypothetical protein